jgi:hypothetical protein
VAFSHLSKNIQLEDVKMHYIHGLGIVSQFSKVFFAESNGCTRENSGRIIASFADCFHFQDAGLVKIDSCFTSGRMTIL